MHYLSTLEYRLQKRIPVEIEKKKRIHCKMQIMQITVLMITIATFAFAANYLHDENLINLQTIPMFLIFPTAILFMIMKSPRKIYLVDFACYNHDPAYLRSKESVLEIMSRQLSPENLAFAEKVMDRSGMCDDRYFYGAPGKEFGPESSFKFAKEETELVMCSAVDDLLAKTRVNPRDIGVVIVNVSMFNPTPSLSAKVVNRYKLREDVLSYNLGGMGCSAGVIAIDLAKRLLQAQRETYALVVSLESITSNYYLGKDRSKLLSCCLFRMGGAAILLSNCQSDRRHSKYELKHTVRTHRGADDKAYQCVVQEQDEAGILGITLSKDLTKVASDAMKANIRALGPLVLPLSEQLKFLASKMKGASPYVPDFKQAFEHFCIHAGGKAVLDAVEKNLNLTKWHMEPSRMTLYRYGNTSSSSLWYELAYTEAKGRIEKGNQVWQIAFGSGFKCNSAVWVALRTINPAKEVSPWINVIDQFPIST